VKIHPIRWILGVPLYWKLVGANAIIVALALFLLSGLGVSIAPISLPYDYFVLTSLLLGTLANVWLVRIALEPIRELQRVAERVSRGAVDERGRAFPQADKRINRLIETTNEMLDRLDEDSRRLKKLGASVVEAQQEERADFARELHDSVAQTLTAASFTLTGILNSSRKKNHAESILEVRELINSASEELRAVSQSLYPRVASDLGLPAALESLAKVVRLRSLIDVFIVTDLDSTFIPTALTATLYWVASEALHEVELRGDANCATIALSSKAGEIALTIVDDGRGEADGNAENTKAAETAFNAARDRFSLAGGRVHIDRVPDGGTRVTACITTDRKAA
jgi:signal transduction histidine kinase